MLKHKINLENLEINPILKEKFGEVPTPLSLINEMLDRLPSAIWKDPNKRWLDPATGIGSFQIIVYERLIKGLASWESNLQKRHDHIIQNMLFMCEINKESVKQVKKVFGQSVNIIQGDFLKTDFKEKTYDIILGNPPFNEGQNIEENGKRGSGNIIWIDFVKKSMSLLEKNGYLLFVHPPGWRKPTTESSKTDGLFKMMAHDRQMIFLEIHDKADGLKLFGVQTRYDWYLLENRPCSKKTVVKDENGIIKKIDLRKWSFLPNSEFSLIRTILGSKTEPKVDIIYSRTQYGTDMSWINSKETPKFKYPLIHSNPKGKDNPRLYWTSTKTPPIKGELVPMFNKKKVIFGEAGINNVIIDNSGKYGMTQGAIGIGFTSEKEGLQLKSVLESDIFKRIINAMSFGNFRIDWRIFLFMKRDFYKILLEKTKTKKTKKTKKTTKNNKNKNKTIKITKNIKFN
jgi:hypothetical protein